MRSVPTKPMLVSSGWEAATYVPGAPMTDAAIGNGSSRSVTIDLYGI